MPLTIAIVVFAVVLLLLTVRVCNQYQRAVVFFLGRYSRTAGPGLYFMLPLLGPSTLRDGPARVVDWKTDLASNWVVY